MHNIQINENNKTITLDIYVMLYVNLPINNILHVTKFWLNKHNHDHIITEQTLYLLEVILKQNYFQYSNHFYQPNKGIAMGSPISSTLAEIYFQYLEETYVKHCLENKEITYYKRYVDDILIVFDKNKIDEDTIHNNINNADEQLEFKISREENETINYLDLSINSKTNNVNLNVYRKPTYIDIAIHFSSNHPYDHKLAAFKYYINRMITMPITEQAVKQEWNRILKVAYNNRFPEQIVHRLRNKLTIKKEQPVKTQPMQQHNKIWVTFTYHGPAVHKVTNLFKCTNLKIAFRPTNTIHQQISKKPNNINPSGIYQLKCNTCKYAYIGQSGS